MPDDLSALTLRNVDSGITSDWLVRVGMHAIVHAALGLHAMLSIPVRLVPELCHAEKQLTIGQHKVKPFV